MKNNNAIKKELKPSIKIIAGILILLALLFLFILLFNKAVITKLPNTLYYKEKGSIDYKVYLKENNYFKEEYLDSENEYIASLIDYIKIDYNYNFNSSESFDYNYKYYITATIIANEKGNTKKLLYNKVETIKDKVTKTNNSNNYDINESINIDYNLYNDIINNFKKDYVLSIDGTLKIDIYIELIGDYNNKELNINKVMTLEIPLLNQIISIEKSINDIDNNDYILVDNITYQYNTIYIIIELIIFIFIVLLIVYIKKCINKLNKKKNIYKINLHKILKEYDSIIVRTKTMPILKKYNTIEVYNFNELLDVHYNSNESILYIDNKDKATFIIINNFIAYIYILENKAKNEK